MEGRGRAREGPTEIGWSVGRSVGGETAFELVEGEGGGRAGAIVAEEEKAIDE